MLAEGLSLSVTLPSTETFLQKDMFLAVSRCLTWLYCAIASALASTLSGESANT